MKYILITLFGLFAIGGVGLGLYTILSTDMTAKKDPMGTNPAPVQTSPSFPIQNTPVPVAVLPPMKVATKDGGSIDVYDFRSTSDSKKETLDTHGDYYLFKKVESDPGYSIAYFVDAQTFNITVTKEPFLETQKKAEAVLGRWLRVSGADLCKLNVSVVPIQNGREGAEATELATCKLI